MEELGVGGGGFPWTSPTGNAADPRGLLQNKALNSAPFLPFKAEHRVNFSFSRLCERNRGPGMGWGNGGRAPPPLGTEQRVWHDYWGPAAAGDGSFTSIAPASPPGQDTHPPALPHGGVGSVPSTHGGQLCGLRLASPPKAQLHDHRSPVLCEKNLPFSC